MELKHTYMHVSIIQYKPLNLTLVELKLVKWQPLWLSVISLNLTLVELKQRYNLVLKNGAGPLNLTLVELKQTSRQCITLQK